MATLDDKLLGEKLHNYCSSSDEEEVEEVNADSSVPVPTSEGSSSNTGPKGVLKDWQRYKQLETERREEAQAEKIALAKKLNFSCKTAREEDEEKERERIIEEELEEILNDDYMQEYMQRRMNEMIKSGKPQKKFGKVVNLHDGQQFLDAIDDEEKTCSVIILIYEANIEACQTMLGCIKCLAQDYPSVKFCQIAGSAAGLSKHFMVSGVPALLIYRAGQLLASFVSLTDQLGENFYATDVESFLIEHALLPDRDVPKIIRQTELREDEDD